MADQVATAQDVDLTELGGLRQRLYDNEFRCLRSFLIALAEKCLADETGVFVRYGGAVEPRRASREDSVFDRLRPVLLEESGRDDYSGCVPVEGQRTHLVLRRIWPDRSWHTRSGESYWLYVYNPVALIPPKDIASPDLLAHFGGVASAFFRWKNELFAQHDELLAAPTTEPDRVIGEFKKLVVRPVRPKDFYYIVTRFRFTDDGRGAGPAVWARWSRHISDLRDACVAPRGGCRCHECPVHGMPEKPPFPCPQTPETDAVLRVIADLARWQTDFWRTDGAADPDAWEAVRDAALAGLRGAADALLVRDPEKHQPIDFWEGAVGLIGERTLVRFFCSRAIRQALALYGDDWGARHPRPHPHPNDLEFPARLASLAATLLGDGRWTSDAITNLLQVVAMFGHRVLGIPARIDLARHLNETLRGETALHTLKTRYRDHFFHTLEVCFLGYALLTSRPDAADPRTFAARILAQCPPGPAGKGDPPRAVPADESDFLAQWWTAALIHDTAYGIDILEGTLSLLDFFSNRADIKKFTDGTRAAVRDLSVKLADVAPELNGDPQPRGDHGVIAAAGLLEAVAAIGPKTRARFLPAVRAVAFHNTRHPAVCAARDPVAALLILCDSVQEWGRSSLGFDRSPSVLLSRMMEATATPAEEQFGPVKRYGVSLVEAAGGYAWRTANELRIELDYGPDALRECRAKQTWADTTYNLQRVDYTPWEVHLSVRISVPLPDGGRTQFEHFGDFIREQQVRFLEDWFRTARLGDEAEAVCHAVARRGPAPAEWERLTAPYDAAARETILLNLPRLSEAYRAERPLMGSTVGRFMEAMRAWSGYSRGLLDTPPVQHPPR